MLQQIFPKMYHKLQDLIEKDQLLVVVEFDSPTIENNDPGSGYCFFQLIDNLYIGNFLIFYV